ncbi:hypothetical protein VdG2_01478 [Verticillium dahliae VDG2]|nr:hypothetical protein VdG2_01478 [Verticillium dahliae VDG2]
MSTTTTTTTTAADPITAESILRLFPDIDTSTEALSGHDEEQIRLMDEVCIVLDENDKPIGNASKKACHLMTNIDKGLLHRAFSGGAALADAVAGVKRAAQRKLEHELGIPAEQVPTDLFRFLTRIHYKAPSDGKWGEHEIDYILFIKANVTLDVNKNEVQATQYVSPDELKALFQDPKLVFTPWFKLICETMLFEWWAHLDAGLEPYMNEQEIRRM